MTDTQNAQSAKRTCILVLGMHRSGTSAVTRVLSLMGATLPKSILGAGPGNETGHWEPERLIALHDQMLAEAGSRWDDWRLLDLETQLPPGRLDHYKSEIRRLLTEEYGDSPLFVLKEPRICRFVPLYREVLAGMEVAVRPVLAFRNPMEVAASLATRNKISPMQSQLYWLRHVLDAERDTRDLPRSLAPYDALLRDWRSTIAPFESELGLNWPNKIDHVAAEIDSFLSPGLRHHVADKTTLANAPAIADWVRRTHAALSRLRDDAMTAMTELDDIGRVFDAGADLFGAAFTVERTENRELTDQLNVRTNVAEKQIAELSDELSTLRAASMETSAALANLQAERDVAKADVEGLHSEWETERQQQAENLAALHQHIETERTKSTQQANRLKSQLKVAEKQIVQLSDELNTLHAAVAEAERHVTETHNAYLNSTSWKLTAPLRKLKFLKVFGNSINVEKMAFALALSDWAPGRVIPAVRHRIRILGLKRTLKLTREVLAREGLAGIQRGIRSSVNIGHIHISSAPGPQNLLDERRTFLMHSALAARPIRPAAVPRILILSDTQLPQCHRYRVQHKVEALQKLGIVTDVISPTDLYCSLNMLQYSSAVIAYRLPNNELFRIHIDEARRLGIPVAYDIDDPLFDEQALGANASLAQLAPSIRDGQLREAVSFREAARACDFCIGSTPNLAKLLQDVAQPRQRKAFVWRNAIDHQTLETGKSLIQSSQRAQDKIVIGYFSGSLAHNSDFDVVRQPLFELMQKNSKVSLVTGGHLGDISEFLSFGSRVQRFPFLDYDHYIRLVASCDLLIVPLCDDLFNRHKSAVRFLDAASAGRPVVASAVGDFMNVISHGETGFVIKNDEWSAILFSLTENKKRLQKIGASARLSVEANYAVDSICTNLESDLRRFLGVSECAY